MKNYRTFMLALIFPAMLMTAVSFAYAWVPGEPIVSCGWTNSCINNVCNYGGACNTKEDCWQPPECTNSCDLYKLGRDIIDFIMIGLSPILATLFFVIAGVMMMLGGSNPGMLAQGKRIFKDTMIGLLIVMMAWLITNTIIQSLAATTVTLPNGQQWTSTNWFKFDCTPTNPPGGGGGPPYPNGRDCANNSDCQSGYCDPTFICQNPPGNCPGDNSLPNGSTCCSGNDCQSAFCNQNVNPPVCE